MMKPPRVNTMSNVKVPTELEITSVLPTAPRNLNKERAIWFTQKYARSCRKNLMAHKFS